MGLKNGKGMKKERYGGLSVTGSRIKEDVKQYGVGILAVVILYFVLHALFDAFCPSVLISGFPCPGCGMTRAVLYLFTGQFKRSWALNPAAVLWVLWAFWFAYERYVKGRKTKGLDRALLGITVFMVAMYIVRMKMYFPDKPPYVYTRNNLFSRTVPGYEEIVKRLFIQ